MALFTKNINNNRDAYYIWRVRGNSKNDLPEKDSEVHNTGQEQTKITKHLNKNKEEKNKADLKNFEILFMNAK